MLWDLRKLSHKPPFEAVITPDGLLLGIKGNFSVVRDAKCEIVSLSLQ